MRRPLPARTSGFLVATVFLLLQVTTLVPSVLTCPGPTAPTPCTMSRNASGTLARCCCSSPEGMQPAATTEISGPLIECLPAPSARVTPIAPLGPGPYARPLAHPFRKVLALAEGAPLRAPPVQ